MSADESQNAAQVPTQSSQAYPTPTPQRTMALSGVVTPAKKKEKEMEKQKNQADDQKKRKVIDIMNAQTNQVSNQSDINGKTNKQQKTGTQSVQETKDRAEKSGQSIEEVVGGVATVASLFHGGLIDAAAHKVADESVKGDDQDDKKGRGKKGGNDPRPNRSDDWS